ncbi:hypothetical protein SAMN04488096_101270 [Mesonia phycicola]|uniref:CarboxypepD_reg-like domain-containing protein n=1 Tax=Mesonia phycicola TaxID=579105 RepID=A0A1M6AHE5_9FLAO|nr:hypothetical protein [Mesonia phycicola]SHI35909.1 hypothetical protein SAMN04488096_101270 [Mesonia phycicola]
MKYFNILIAFLFFNLAFSQNFIVADKESKKPLPYVSVYSINAGVYSNVEGRVELNDKFQLNDTLTIEILGFKSVKNTVLNFQELDTIFLEPKVEKLAEVKLNNGQEFIVIEKGSSPRSYTSCPLNNTTEFISVLTPKSTVANNLVNKVKLYFLKPRGFKYKKKMLKGHKLVFRMNLYRFSSDNDFEKLYMSEIFYINILEKDDVELNIDKYIPFYEEGLAVGVEHIGEVDSQMNFVEKPFSRGPALTSDVNDYYQAASFLRFSFSEKPTYRPYSALPYVSSKKDERNLQLDLELIK